MCSLHMSYVAFIHSKLTRLSNLHQILIPRACNKEGMKTDRTPMKSVNQSVYQLLYSHSHTRTFDYKRIPLFWPYLSFKFSVTLCENAFKYKRTF